jgi:hypothetical protein
MIESTPYPEVLQFPPAAVLKIGRIATPGLELIENSAFN